MRSDNVTKGSERAPNRSLFYALGYTPEELDRPLIGVVSAYSEIVPGHMNLDKIADAVKAGVQMAGGTPILIPAIGVCDGIAMGHVGMKYSLASRELICDSVETMLMAHQLDGLVLVPNCDKIVPGMVMAAVRMDVPAVVCSGGPMLAGTYGGEEVSLSKMFEAVGAYKAGMITDEQLEDCTCNCCPSCGSCSGSIIIYLDMTFIMSFFNISRISGVHPARSAISRNSSRFFAMFPEFLPVRIWNSLFFIYARFKRPLNIWKNPLFFSSPISGTS